MSESKFSRKLGRGLARIQSFVDDTLTAGFNLLKKAGSKKKEVDTSTTKGKVVSGLKKTAGFIGETGDSFYKEYDRLKAKKHDKDQNKS